MTPTCLVAPSYVPPRCGSGGAWDQVAEHELYSSNATAVHWLRYESGEEYRAKFADLPLLPAAAAIAERATGPLDVLALGPGTAHHEVLLVQHLLAGRPVPADLRLFLIDLAQAMVWAAHQHAAAVLGAYPGVFPLGVQGNMHELPGYTQLLHQPPGHPRRRLVTMLGATLGNLDDEPGFVEYALNPALSPGDLLLFDVCLTPARPEDDARLSGQVAPGQAPALWAWMAEVLRGRGQELSGLEVVPIERGQKVPGSYAVAFVGRTAGSEVVQLARIGRYDADHLVATFQTLGWQDVATFRFGGAYPRALFLFQKVFQKGGQS